jgi:hypothetical protein
MAVYDLAQGYTAPEPPVWFPRVQPNEEYASGATYHLGLLWHFYENRHRFSPHDLNLSRVRYLANCVRILRRHPRARYAS